MFEKVIGGSSSMNAMMYARGHKLFYDDIGKQNKGWSYDEVVKCNQIKKKNLKKTFYQISKN